MARRRPQHEGKVTKRLTVYARVRAPRPPHRRCDPPPRFGSRDLDSVWRPGRSNAEISLSPGLLNVKFLLDATASTKAGSWLTTIRCFVPDFDGASLSNDSKGALWDRFYTGAPQ